MSSSPMGCFRVLKPCLSMHWNGVIAKPCLAMNEGGLFRVVDSQVCGACIPPAVCNWWGDVVACFLYVRRLNFCVAIVIVAVDVPIIVDAVAYDYVLQLLCLVFLQGQRYPNFGNAVGFAVDDLQGLVAVVLGIFGSVGMTVVLGSMVVTDTF